MRWLVFLLLLVLVFAGVAVYLLQQKGLHARDILAFLRERQPVSRGEELSPAEPVGLAASVQKKQQELRAEAERVKRLTERMEKERRELEAERALLEEHLNKLEAESTAPDEELATLVKLYEGMPPEQAASILENLPDPTVARILLQMRKRQAAQILGSLNPNKAASISRLLLPERAETMP